MRSVYFLHHDIRITQKSLLADTGWAYRSHPQENQGIEVRHYLLRETAWETLQYWGIEVDKPELFNRIDRRKPGGQKRQ